MEEEVIEFAYKCYINVKLPLFYRQVDLKNSLLSHKITNELRSKMVDWMIEVFGNYKPSSSDKTLFRAVFILDLFNKKC